MTKSEDSRGVNMKMTKKFLAIMMAMMVVLTSIPFVSFGASSTSTLAEPSIPTIKKVDIDKKKNKKDKKYHITITLAQKVKCNGYTLYKVNKATSKEKKLKDFSSKSKKLVYKSKSKVKDTDEFVLKAYITYYKYKKGKTVKWVTKKPAKKYLKGTKKVYSGTNQEKINEELTREQGKDTPSDPTPTPEPTPEPTPTPAPTPVNPGFSGSGTVDNPPVLNSDKTYTGEAIDLLSSKGKSTGGTLVYCVTTDKGNTPPADKEFGLTHTAKKAGTYYVWYYVKADDSHTDSAKIKIGPVEIKKAAIVVTAKDQTYKYDGNAHGEAITVKTVNNQPATIMYGTKDGEYNLPVAPKRTEEGTHDIVYYKVTAPNHEDKTGTYKIIIPDPKDYITTPAK